MARATIKLDTEVAARLRAAKLDLSNDAGRMLTVDGQIDWLLDFWMAHRRDDGGQAAELAGAGNGITR